MASKEKLVTESEDIASRDSPPQSNKSMETIAQKGKQTRYNCRGGNSLSSWLIMVFHCAE